MLPDVSIETSSAYFPAESPQLRIAPEGAIMRLKRDISAVQVYYTSCDGLEGADQSSDGCFSSAITK
jgi:hypothetical protein